METSERDGPQTTRRPRGSIRRHGTGYQVRVTAGTDPVTRDRVVLVDHAASLREAEKLRTKLLAEADSYRAARTKASLGYLLDRWLPQYDVDETTRATYDSLIRNHIGPALGALPLSRAGRAACCRAGARRPARPLAHR